MTKSVQRTGLTVALLLFFALGGEARGEGDVTNLMKKVADPSQKFEDRSKALAEAVSLSRNKAYPKRAEAVRPVLPALLKEFGPKRAEATYHDILIEAMAAFTLFERDPEVPGLIRPFLGKDTPDKLRETALSVLRTHGATGLTKELMAILEEPGKSKDKARAGLLNQVVMAAAATPGNESVVVLEAALKQKTYKTVRICALWELGNFAAVRAPGEIDHAKVRTTLLASTQEKDVNVSCTAALAMTRFGSLEGIGKLIERCGPDAGNWSREAYGAVCRGLYVAGGFDGVVPHKFFEVDRETRAAAIRSLHKRWEDCKGRNPEDLFFDTLAVGGVRIPKDKQGKEAVTALIEGMDSESREVRYMALDLFVKRTGRTDVGENFRTLRTISGPPEAQLEIRQPEPPDGFEHAQQTANLREQQKAMVKEIKSWWEKAQVKAVLKDGVWVIPAK